MKNSLPASQICSRCIYDTTIPGIHFDDKGICQFCAMHDEMDKLYPLNNSTHQRLENIITQIKADKRRKKYDCIVGVSGGVDSTYTLYKAVEMGLTPLAVHFDNGWNSEIAVHNIEKATKKLGVDLETVVANWEEFKDLQKSFLQASVSDAEIPTDVTIHAVLHDIAVKENIRYILIGHSFRTEGIVPKAWTYMDSRYIASVHKKFGSLKIKSFPTLTVENLLYCWFVKRIVSIPFLNYFNYDKNDAGTELESQLGWRNYGGHHHESLYTIFFQSYYLPTKFNIDKRKLSLSAQIRSGRIQRETALQKIRETSYPLDNTLVDYAVKKLGLTDTEFKEIMNAPNKSFLDYPSYYPLILFFRLPIFIAFKLNLVPKILYYKFLG